MEKLVTHDYKHGSYLSGWCFKVSVQRQICGIFQIYAIKMAKNSKNVEICGKKIGRNSKKEVQKMPKIRVGLLYIKKFC